MRVAALSLVLLGCGQAPAQSAGLDASDDGADAGFHKQPDDASAEAPAPGDARAVEAAASDAPGQDPCCQCLAAHCSDLLSQCQSDMGCAGSYSMLCSCEADAGDTSTNCFIFFAMDGPLQQAIIQCAKSAPCCLWH